MMELTLTFASWWIPAAITIIACGAAIFWPTDSSGGWLPDLTPILLLVPALFVSAIAWAVWGFLR